MDEPSVTIGVFDSDEMNQLLNDLWEAERKLRVGLVDAKAGALLIREALHTYERRQMGMATQDPSIHRGIQGLTYKDPKDNA